MSVQAQKILVGLLSLVLFVALAIAGGIDRSRRPQMAPDSAAVAAFTNPQFARGREVYAKYSCNACHGAAGKGGIRNLNAESGGQINGLLKVNESSARISVVGEEGQVTFRVSAVDRRAGSALTLDMPVRTEADAADRTVRVRMANELARHFGTAPIRSARL